MKERQYAAAKGRPRPPWLRALGLAEPPEEITVEGVFYQLAEIFKHDSVAATALYRSVPDAREIICKFNRQQSLFGLPLRWLGNRLGRRERFFHTLLADLPCIPRLRSPVSAGGAELEHTMAHDFVPGNVLKKTDRLPAAFFDAIATHISCLHERGVFLLDLEKRENIIVGDDGDPHLIDFQIALHIPPKANFPFAERLRRELRRCNEYYLAKHKFRHATEGACSQEELDAMRPLLIRMHHIFVQPLIWVRRRVLVLSGVRTGKGKRDSEHFIEVGLRDEETPPSKGSKQ